MTASGDIASVEVKLDLGVQTRNKIPSFSSYLTKPKIEDKKNKKDNNKVLKADMPVFKKLSEDVFYNIQNIIRKNNIDIKEVYMSENKINENNSNNYNKTKQELYKVVSFYSKEDCDFVFEGFKEYEIIRKDNSITFIL